MDSVHPYSGRTRSAFRYDVDYDSGLKAIGIPDENDHASGAANQRLGLGRKGDRNRGTDRRMKRIVEDNAARSPEAGQAGLAQIYIISNPNKKQDLFINPAQLDYAAANGVPSACSIPGVTPPTEFPNGQPVDSNGNPVTNSAGNDSFCITNPGGAGTIGSDGIPDGFVDPVRIYKAVEFEVNKSMSRGWQMRANYRIAKFIGNYEGSFRNDNNQNDPNISSLFDFTRGDFNLLGQQFVSGVLNTDVRHLANGFVSYTWVETKPRALPSVLPCIFKRVSRSTICLPTRCTRMVGKFRSAPTIPPTVRRRVVLWAASRQADRKGPSAVTGNSNPGCQRPFYARFGVKLEF